jgi:tetratricopeptide (TPR) repeat protein
VSRLAELYYSQRRYAEAESFAKRLLEIAEKDRGPDSTTVVTTLHWLAEISRAQGKIGEAETLYKRALAICEQPGHNQQELARNLELLALFYRLTDHVGDAELLETRRARLR